MRMCDTAKGPEKLLNGAWFEIVLSPLQIKYIYILGDNSVHLLYHTFQNASESIL